MESKTYTESNAAFQRLGEILDTLRRECPWDRVQTMKSLRYLTIEEVHELSEAIVALDSSEFGTRNSELADASNSSEFGVRNSELADASNSSELGVRNSELADASNSSEFGVRNSELADASNSSEFGVRNSELADASNSSEFGVRNSELADASNSSEFGTQNSELRSPNSKLKTPNSELRTPNSELRSPNSKLRSPNSELISALKKELGDIAMHILFYCKLAEEQGLFTTADVYNTICEKLIARHPFIYHKDDYHGESWEQLKMREGRRDVLEGVPDSLPSLVKAVRMQEKVAGMSSELGAHISVVCPASLPSELRTPNSELSEAEFGDLLFALVDWGRQHGINADDALCGANLRFKERMKKLMNDENQ